jgi:hypothetical protein
MPTTPAVVFAVAEPVSSYQPVTPNRTAVNAITPAAASLAVPTRAGMSIAAAAARRRTPRPALVEPGGASSVVSPRTVQVPARIAMPVAVTGSRER